jgi:hypothetical protein
MFVPVKRATLLFTTGNVTSTTKHLFILLTDPTGPAKQVAMACLCTIRGEHDKACLINVGDHPYVTDPSYIAYRLCRVERSDALTKGVQNGHFVDKGMMDQPVFDRVLAGVAESSFTRPFITQFLDEANK